MNEKSIQQKSTFWMGVLVVAVSSTLLHFNDITTPYWAGLVGLVVGGYFSRESLRDRAKPTNGGSQ